jgi:hypothetical protein
MSKVFQIHLLFVGILYEFRLNLVSLLVKSKRQLCVALNVLGFHSDFRELEM